jgi:3-isopropylmalate/(R)-2-methylmalate dehydratase small subunit
MRRFVTHRGVAAPLLQINIDTDAVIPSQELKRVSKIGLGESLFAGWRYLDRGEPSERPNPEFVLNRPEYSGASILLAGLNMGCGSSREYAVWAFDDFGIRAIIAPSFGAIFYTNCMRNGLLPVVLSEDIVASLAAQIAGDPQARQLSIDLEECSVLAPDGQRYQFDIEPAYREMLIEGLDAIDVTLKSHDAIAAFIASDRKKRSWSYLA